MQTHLEIFDEWCNQLDPNGNPILPPRFIPPLEIAQPFADKQYEIDRRVRLIRPLFLPNRNIEIHANFLDSGSCDAVATIYKKLGIIAMTKGFVLLPLDLICRMFSHPEILPDIGNSKLERRGPGHDDGMPDDFNDLERRRRAAGRSPYARLPLDATRRGVAQLCIDLLWNFIAMHEAVHILHGHVRYVHAVRGIEYLLDAHDTLKVPHLSQDDLDFQTIELWADSKAVSAGLRGLLNFSDGQFLQSVAPEAAHRLFLWTFSIYTLFRIWGLRINPSAMQGLRHPPTAVRYDMILRQAKADFEELYPSLADQFWQIVLHAHRDAEIAIAYCGGIRLDVQDIAGLTDPKVDLHLQALMEHFEKMLLPEMPKYSFVPLNVVRPELNSGSPTGNLYMRWTA